MKSTGLFLQGLFFAAATLFALPTFAQDHDIDPARYKPPAPEYSPYLEHNYPDRVYYGDTHVHTAAMLPREYAREALKRGLAYEQKFGVNPFKFGMIGSTDTHAALATTTEDNFFGKVTPVEPSADPGRFDEIIVGVNQKDPNLRIYSRQTSASGLAAVWAKENTREALWDAMARKEVYATTGTRLVVRVFAGYDFVADDVNRPDFAKRGYEHGVPMGSDLPPAAKGKSPALIIRALRDVDGANLDRI